MDRNFRACFYTSMFLLFVGFLVICAALAVLVSYTISIPSSNKTDAVDATSSMQWLNSIKGNSPEQSILILFIAFLVFGLSVCVCGFFTLCCSVSFGNAIYPEKSGFVNGRRQVRPRNLDFKMKTFDWSEKLASESNKEPKNQGHRNGSIIGDNLSLSNTIVN